MMHTGDQRGEREADRERRHHRAGHAAADAAGLYSEVSVSATGTSPPRPKFERKRNTASDSTFHDAADEPGEQREDADRCRERGAAADVVGDRAPEQRAEERADQADGRQQIPPAPD